MSQSEPYFDGLKGKSIVDSESAEKVDYLGPDLLGPGLRPNEEFQEGHGVPQKHLINLR